MLVNPLLVQTLSLTFRQVQPTYFVQKEQMCNYSYDKSGNLWFTSSLITTNFGIIMTQYSTSVVIRRYTVKKYPFKDYRDSIDYHDSNFFTITQHYQDVCPYIQVRVGIIHLTELLISLNKSMFYHLKTGAIRIAEIF